MMPSWRHSLEITPAVGDAERLKTELLVIGGSRPGGVVTSLSGQAIEIHTDEAEGRLLLCDLLTYAERFMPACVVDIATRTEACVAARGAHDSGLFSNNDTLAAELMRCAGLAGDRDWQVPPWNDYYGRLDSSAASTGRPVPLLAEFLINRASEAAAFGHSAPTLAVMEPHR